VVVAAILLFGWRFGPRPEPAEASVFSRIFGISPEVPAYLGQGATDSGPRRVELNGQTLTYAISTTQDDIDTVLDYYGRRFEVDGPAVIDPEMLKDAVGPEMARWREVLPWAEERYRQRYFRFDGANWGCLGLFDRHWEPGADGLQQFGQAMEAFGESRDLGDLGIGKVVLAFAEGRRTTVFRLWLENGLDLDLLLAPPGQDALGEDPPDVPRYPGDRRLLSLRSDGLASRDQLVMYEGGGTIGGNALFFRARMAALGWQRYLPRGRAAGQLEENPLFFFRNGRECMIAFTEQRRSGRLRTVVVERELGS
jgi:hypothetical protein